MKIAAMLAIVLVFSLWPAHASADSQVVKEACAFTFEYKSMTELQAAIETKAKQLAVSELFGEVLTALTTVENFQVTGDTISSYVAGVVRVRSVEFFNGQNLGEICVRVTVFITESDRAQFEPALIASRKCLADANLSARTLRERTRQEVLVEAIIAYEPDLADLEQRRLLRLVQKITYGESDFLSDTDTFCAAVEAYVLPVEITALLAQATPMPTATRTPRQAMPTRTPTPVRTVSPASATATAFANRTPTFTPTPSPTPDATTTAVALMVDVLATAEAAPHHLYDLWVNPIDEAVYVYVPAGEFTMGSGNGQADERPVHRVQLDAFWIMRTEVTNSQYERCVRARVCTTPDNSVWSDVRFAEHPVTDIDWAQANAYAQWVGGSLPTEAMWEKACRGNDLRTYPWGEQAPDATLLNFPASGISGTVAVGSYPAGASPYGAFDLAGNVWEYTADWYGEAYYAQSPLENPKGPLTGSDRVLRGGSWRTEANVRCAYRGWYNPDPRNAFLGFRVVVPDSLVSRR